MCGNIRFRYHFYLPLSVYQIVIVSGAKVLRVINETRLSESYVTFRLRAPPFLPEEPRCTCAVFWEISCVTCIAVMSCIRHVGSMKRLLSLLQWEERIATVIDLICLSLNTITYSSQ